MQHKAALNDAVARPLWHDPEIMPEPQPALVKDEKCELLIVGGGFTGLWAAMQAKERRPDADIVLIEQTFVGDGASGRCGGFLNPDLAHGESNTDAHFPGEGERLEELGEQNIKEYIETLEKYNIDARYEKVGVTEVALNADMAAKLRQDYEKAEAEGSDVVWLEGAELQQHVNSPLIQAALWYRDGLGGVVDPARVCWGLKDVLMNQLGVRIYEGTKLLNLQPVGKDSMVANCEFAQVHADKVLLATNAFKNEIGRARRSVIPVWDYQICTEPLTEEQLERVKWGKPESRHALADYNNMFHYFRLTKDNRITWGGGGAVRYYFNNGTDRKYMDAQPRYEQLAQEFFEYFPELHDVKFSNKWGGIIATSTRFCMVPGSVFDGRVAWAIGYTGLGVGATRFGARIGIEMLGYEPSDILDMQFVKKRALPWAPEPFRWFGVKMTQQALIKADKNNGKRGLWLQFLDALGLGFTC